MMFAKLSETMQRLFQELKLEGFSLEGPFFSEVHKGAQNPKYMGDPKN